MAPTAEPHHSARRRWWWRNVAWIGVALVAGLTAFAAFDLVRTYDAAVRENEREIEIQARVVAEQTTRSVQAIDLVLRHLAQQPRSLASVDLHDYLKDQAVGLVQVEALAVFAADGRLVANSRQADPPPLNISADPLFRQLAAARSAQLTIGTTRSAWFSEQPALVFPIARRLETADGRFGGIVYAGGRVEYYQRFYNDMQLDSGTSIALLKHDGTLLARHPPQPAALGQRIASFDDLLAPQQSAPRRSLRGTSPVDGVERFGVANQVPDYPLAVVVTRDAALALLPWREQAVATLAHTLVLGVMSLLLLWLVRRQFRRLDQTRQSLEVSRERFALAAAGSDEGIWDWDLAGDRVYASARAREIFGLEPGPEIQPRESWFNLVSLHPEDVEGRRAAMRAHLDGDTPVYAGEYRVLGLDGHYRWVRVRGLCVRDSSGQPLRMAGSVADITARKQADEALRLSKERFALAVAGSDDGVWDWDFSAGIAFESARARELQGLPPGPEEQPLSQLLESLRVHPDDVGRRAEALRAHLDGETAAYECEYRVRHDDGEYRWIRVRALCIRDESGKPCRIAGSVSDIDSRKRAEEALRRSDERYQLAVAGSNEGLWDWDLASDSLFLSPRAQELLWLQAGPPQRPRREWIAMTDYHPDDIALVRSAIAAHLHGQTLHFKVEYRIRRQNGEWRWFRQRGIAVRDVQGRPTRMAGSMEDITERKHSEAERERLELQLRQAQKLEAIGTLAGGIAHDFNNILSAILGYGEMALKDAAKGSAQLRNIEAAMSAGMRAKSLVERILAFSRSGIGEKVPVHVQSVVVEALEGVAASLPSGVVLDRRLDGGNAAVLGDATQVHQVVMNLCANAVQAMKNRGTLTVTLERVELGEPCCTTSVTLDSGEYVALRVRDTGSGISAPLLERIFDPFFTTKEVGVGTGLGLSLVHGIVTDLGGGICVDSRVGEGSTFTVFLPRQHDIAAAAAAGETRPPLGNGETILLVDDEEPLVRLGEEMIALLGYEPVGFTSSVDALATFRAEPERFHAVLSDEAMPDMTGSELIEQIRLIRPDIPIVLMSGYVTATLATRAREAGVAEVLSKPLVSRDIARSLASALHR